jgi:CHASE3 domain sensor protein
VPARTEADAVATEEQKKANRRLGVILATVALVFFVGFMARMVLLGR